MNNIQKLINELEVEKENANKDSEQFKHNQYIVIEQQGRVQAFSFCIHKLKLLLKDESKQPQPPISQTPMLGEVLHVVNNQQEDTTQAVEGATPVVRQNEQTKEVKKAIPFGIAMLRAKQYYRNSNNDDIPF